MSDIAGLHERFLREVAAQASPGHRVYARGIAANQRAALAAAYPAVERLVGAAFFGELALRHAARHPSTSGDLHRFGARLGDFIAQDPWCAPLPWLGDVARLEWAMHEAGLAQDEAPFDASRLGDGSEERQLALRPRLHGSVRLLESRFAVADIVAANRGDATGEVDEVDRACRVIVWRDQANRVRTREAEEAHWRVATACRDGACLGEFLAGGEEAVGALASLVAAGIVGRCDG